MALRIRRVVTGVDSAGRSRIESDAAIEAVSASGAVKLIWKTETVPAYNDGEIASSEGEFDFSLLRRGGIGLLIVEIQPGCELTPPGMHATDTLDWLIILRGRLELVVDTGTVVLEPGDVLVDRGVYHGSRALGNESVVMAVVLIPAEPIEAPTP